MKIKRRCLRRAWSMPPSAFLPRKVCWRASYKSAANRSYYAVFHAMRAVLAFDEIDMKKHGGVIAEFRRLYIKTGIFESKLSTIISVLFDIRTESDYDDFFIISKDEVIHQVESARYFLGVISEYLAEK